MHGWWASLSHAAGFVAPGGMLVFCTCSLEPEEGPDQVARFLASHSNFERAPLTADEVFGQEDFITAEGDLRTLPCHWDTLGGLDGFYAARLKRANGA